MIKDEYIPPVITQNEIIDNELERLHELLNTQEKEWAKEMIKNLHSCFHGKYFIETRSK